MEDPHRVRRAPQHHHPHRPAAGEKFELDLVLRNNITTREHPLGVYHPHAELHHIKKENIGLIEVMGLAVLPARLKEELAEVVAGLATGSDLRANELTEKHAGWAEGFAKNYTITKDNALDIVQKETGLVFAQVLGHAGVYKRTPKGKKEFLLFWTKYDVYMWKQQIVRC